MLYWNANFQIPNSGVQAADVYAVIEGNEVKFYGDKSLTILLFAKNYTFDGVQDPYNYLLGLEEFANYKKI